MERLIKIVRHPLFVECLEKTEKAEETREFCKHGIQHLLDTARIAYIRSLEEGSGLKKDIIYAAAFLHDIGRKDEYEKGIPHETAGAAIALKIIEETGAFSEEEKDMIITAVSEHRNKDGDVSLLGRFIYEGDKLSRMCFSCSAYDKCNWSEERKNKEIEF